MPCLPLFVAALTGQLDSPKNRPPPKHLITVARAEQKTLVRTNNDAHAKHGLLRERNYQEKRAGIIRAPRPQTHRLQQFRQHDG
jgi:hypothetical protein